MKQITLLLLCAALAVGIKAADIGDADALGVVARAVGTDLFDGTA